MLENLVFTQEQRIAAHELFLKYVERFTKELKLPPTTIDINDSENRTGTDRLEPTDTDYYIEAVWENEHSTFELTFWQSSDHGVYNSPVTGKEEEMFEVEGESHFFDLRVYSKLKGVDNNAIQHLVNRLDELHDVDFGRVVRSFESESLFSKLRQPIAITKED